MRKYAKAQVIDVKGAPTRQRQASLEHLSDFHDYRTDDGYMYVRIRSISSRVNKNHDGWPTVELAGGEDAWKKYKESHTAAEGFTVEAADGNEKYGFRTHLGKPIFVDHNNSDPKRTRGAVVDSKFRVLDEKTASEDKYWNGADVDPEHLPASEVELLLEIDAKSFPKLAKAIANGDIDGFSMGCDVDYSKCSHCGNKAESPDEYCSHIQMKGKNFTHTTSDGKTSSKKSYENCYGVKFFEISAVFDPADETALAREVINEKAAKTAEYWAGPPVDQALGFQVNPEEVTALAAEYMSRGVDENAAMNMARLNLTKQLPGIPAGADSALLDNKLRRHEYTPLPQGMNYNDLRAPIEPFPNDPRWSKSAGMEKTAEPDLPQSFQTTAPEDVDTLRTERICPVCGNDIDKSKCDVCGYEPPPESLQNPDLDKAQENDFGNEDVPEGAEGPPMDADQQVNEALNEKMEGSFLTNNPRTTATRINDMRSWNPRVYGGQYVIAATPKPSGDEPPKETVIADQDQPVTSAFRTAQELIEAAKRNPTGDNMHEERTAAEPVPAAKPDKRVNVEGVGGVMQDTNEQASKPRGPHSWEAEGVTVDVTGKGGVMQDTNAEASKPDEKQSVEETSENAGFQPGGEKGPKTKTWSENNNASPVTDKAVQSAKKGTDPVDKSGKPDSRVDVEEQVEVHWHGGDGQTQTWHGTDGNGVTRQQNPITKGTIEGDNIVNLHPRSSGMVSIAALRLADIEVELGLTPAEKKYDRLVELSELSPEALAAEGRMATRVKQAGLARQASAQPKRMPSFRQATVEEPAAAQPLDDQTMDSAIFGR